MSTELVHADNKLMVPLSILDQQIVSLYSDGVNIKDIAIELGISVPSIRRALNKPEIREAANDVIMNMGISLKAEKLRLINAVVNDKLEKLDEQVDEEGNKTGRLADITNKDVFDLISMADGMQKEKEKADLGNTTNNVYINLLNQIMD